MLPNTSLIRNLVVVPFPCTLQRIGSFCLCLCCAVCSSCPGGYCWNAKHCQKIERPRCHRQCLGECSGPTALDCYTCKNYQHEGRCVESCPPHL